MSKLFDIVLDSPSGELENPTATTEAGRPIYGYVEKSLTENDLLEPPNPQSNMAHWKEVHPYNDGRALVRNDLHRYGYIDSRGIITIPCLWENATSFINGYALVLGANYKWGCIDLTGNLVLPYEWRTGRICNGELTLTKEKYRFFYTDIETFVVSKHGEAKWQSTKREWHTGRSGTGRWG